MSAHTKTIRVETLARVEEFNETERAIFCGRCRRPMRNGEMDPVDPSVFTIVWVKPGVFVTAWLNNPLAPGNVPK